MVRWADVPDSDRGDFRRRRAVDISSFKAFLYYNLMMYGATTEKCVYFGGNFVREVRFYLFQYTTRTVQIFVKDYEILSQVSSRLTLK